MSEACPSCERPKYTEADLARWKAEIGDGDARDFDPEWARRLCWTKREFTCICKPAQEASASP